MNKQYSPVERANRNSYKAVSSGTTSNKWKWIAITLTIFLLVVGVVYFDNQAQKEQYNRGYETGVNQTYQLIAYSQTEFGNVLLWNGTAIITMPINTICQNINRGNETQ